MTSFDEAQKGWEQCGEAFRRTSEQALAFDPLRSGWTKQTRLEEWSRLHRQCLERCQQLDAFVRDHAPVPAPITARGNSLLITSHSPEGYEHLGTGVLLFPGCALVTRETTLSILQKNAGSCNRGAGSQSIYAVQLASNSTVRVWTIVKIETADESETSISFLHLMEDTESAYPSLKIRLMPPRVGSTICSISYAAPALGTGELGIVASLQEPIVTWALVERIYEFERLPGIPDLPCYQVTSTLGTGPVFDERGVLCGLTLLPGISTPPYNLSSFVSPIWPSLTTMVTYPREGRPRGMRYPAFHLARDGVMQSIDQHNFRCDWDVASKEIRLRFA